MTKKLNADRLNELASINFTFSMAEDEVMEVMA